MASPWVEACIESAYSWLEARGVRRPLIEAYAVDLEISAIGRFGEGCFAWTVPNLEPPDPEADRWGVFLATAKAYGEVQGTSSEWEKPLAVEFERLFAQTIQRMDSERDAQSRRRKGAEAPWKAEVRQLVVTNGTRDFDQILGAIEAAVDQGCFTAVNHDWETIRYEAGGKDRDIQFSTLRNFLSRPSRNNLPS